MQPITIKNVTFQQGKSAICVPICARTIDELKQACACVNERVDVIEWRMDYFQGTALKDWQDALTLFYTNCRSYVLLATWRSEREGGVQPCEPTFYRELIEMVISSHQIDFIDVELFSGEETVNSLVELAHQHQVQVVLSNHDWKQTPSKEAMSIRLHAMQKLGADFVKLAVMPQCIEDVWALFEVSSAYAQEATSKPLISMAMGKLGTLSRIAGSFDGSIMTFASLSKASAPGQLALDDLVEILRRLEG